MRKDALGYNNVYMPLTWKGMFLFHRFRAQQKVSSAKFLLRSFQYFLRVEFRIKRNEHVVTSLCIYRQRRAHPAWIIFGVSLICKL